MDASSDVQEFHLLLVKGPFPRREEASRAVGSA